MTEVREQERIKALKKYDILDTPPDGSFDRIVNIASKMLNVPIAIVSLVDTDRIWFKAITGLNAQQINRDPGLCASAILSEDIYLVEDARRDVRTLSNPLVTGELGLQFYAAAPLKTSDGHNLGTLCVLDQQPRTLTEEEKQVLKDLAEIVMDQMELRLSALSAIKELKHKNKELEETAHQLSETNSQNQILLAELHHRVKNNLATIASLLSLQGGDASESLRNRIMSMALIHEKLYQRPGNYNEVNFKEYLLDLINKISFAYSSEKRISISTDIEEIQINMQSALPLGMLCSEIITNAFKYAFQGKDKGEITIIFKREDNSSGKLIIADNGIGLEEDGDEKNTLGKKLIDALAEQLDAKLTVDNKNGLRYQFNIPLGN